MARKYVNPNRPARPVQRIQGQADLERLMARDPGPWTLIKTAELDSLLGRPGNRASGPAEMSEAELYRLFTGGSR